MTQCSMLLKAFKSSSRISDYPLIFLILILQFLSLALQFAISSIFSNALAFLWEYPFIVWLY